MVEQMRSSLPYEVLLYFNRRYDVIFFFVTLAVFVYKGISLPYPADALGWEIAFLFLWVPTEYARLFMGSKGNLTEQQWSVGLSLALSLFTLVLHMYYLFLQVFVLRIDEVMNSISLGFLGLEFILGLFAMLQFGSSSAF